MSRSIHYCTALGVYCLFFAGCASVWPGRAAPGGALPGWVVNAPADGGAYYEVGSSNPFLDEHKALAAAQQNAQARLARRLGVEVVSRKIDISRGGGGGFVALAEETLIEGVTALVAERCERVASHWDSAAQKAHVLVALRRGDWRDWTPFPPAGAHRVAAAGPRPAWLDALPADADYYHAVGFADPHLDDSDGFAAADKVARTQLAASIRTEVRSVIVDADMGNRANSLDTYVETLTRVTLSGAAVVDRWKDPSAETFHSLARIRKESVRAALDGGDQRNARRD